MDNFFENPYGIVKSLHIIFMVTWFAGLFYIVRLFVYHAEAQGKDEPKRTILTEQFKIMEWRLWYIITWPSMILTLLFGFWLLYIMPSFLQQAFMHMKLGLVGLLVLYHLYCHRLFNKLQLDGSKISPQKFRFLNEGATVLLIAIVFIIVLKSAFSWVWGVVGIMGLAVVLMIAIKWYKRLREKNEN